MLRGLCICKVVYFCVDLVSPLHEKARLAHVVVLTRVMRMVLEWWWYG